MKGDKVVVPDYSTVRKLPKNFADLARERRGLNSDMKTLKERADEINEILTAALMASKVKSVGVDDVPVTLVKGTGQSRIDGKRLLEKGVSSTVIQYATIQGKEYYYTSVGKEREDSGLVG